MTTEQRKEGLEWRPWWVKPLKVTGVIVLALVVAAFWLASNLTIGPARDGPETTARHRCDEYLQKTLEWHTVRGEYPKSLEAMEAPLAPGDEENFVRLEDDPWGNPYVLRREQRAKEIYVCSWGPDGKEGTWDDIEFP